MSKPISEYKCNSNLDIEAVCARAGLSRDDQDRTSRQSGRDEETRAKTSR